MNTLYAKNGLVFWSEEEIETRKSFETFFVRKLSNCLKTLNRGFEFVQVEASLLTPRNLVNPQYTNEDIFVVDDLVLRPETTMGSFIAAKDLLNSHNARKFKLPLVVWQHGKSFRKEQDQPLNHMRLKEFYQLEFQILFSPETKNDYAPSVIEAVRQMIWEQIGPCRVEASDRLPSYSEWTQDVICEKTSMEVCSISKRKDFEGVSVIEVAIGTDRCIYNRQVLYSADVDDTNPNAA